MWCTLKIACNANFQNHVMHGTTIFPIVWTNFNPTVLMPDKELCKSSRRIELPANRQNRHQLSKITEYAAVWENLKHDRRTQITGKRATNIIYIPFCHQCSECQSRLGQWIASRLSHSSSMVQSLEAWGLLNEIARPFPPALISS